MRQGNIRRESPVVSRFSSPAHAGRLKTLLGGWPALAPPTTAGALPFLRSVGAGPHVVTKAAPLVAGFDEWALRTLICWSLVTTRPKAHIIRIAAQRRSRLPVPTRRNPRRVGQPRLPVINEKNSRVGQPPKPRGISLEPFQTSESASFPAVPGDPVPPFTKTRNADYPQDRIQRVLWF